MAAYNKIIGEYINGKDLIAIHEATKCQITTIKHAIFEYNRQIVETKEDRLMQAKSIESELFSKIELEKITGKKDKSIDTLAHIYSTYLIN
jgi:heme oxygenase